MCTLKSILLRLIFFSFLSSFSSFQSHLQHPQMLNSNRIQNTGEPHIENILDKYFNLTGLINLALGSSYWTPPITAIEKVLPEIYARSSHRYGNIMGDHDLHTSISKYLVSRGLNMQDQDICITAGANQAFVNAALSLCDGKDEVIVIAPYYFCHLSSLQLCETKVTIAPFQKSTLEPDCGELSALVTNLKPKMVRKK